MLLDLPVAILTHLKVGSLNIGKELLNTYQNIRSDIAVHYDAMKHSLDHHTKVLHCSHGIAHAAYLSAVFIEGHGMYAAAAGVLLVITVATYINNGIE
jgi:hypothetical protein